MRIPSAVLVCLAASVAGVAAYSAHLRDADMPTVVNNTLLHVLVNQCLLGGMQCGPMWEDIRDDAKEIYQTKCGKCSPKEKFNVKIYRDATRKKFPQTWEAIVNTFKS